MLSKKTKKRLQKLRGHVLVPVLVCLILSAGGVGVLHAVNAQTDTDPVSLVLPPNVGVRPYVEEFFLANDAADMLPIIECESHFNHYEDDGTTLKNRAGSSAIGIAQILASKHPDPKVIKRYNRKYNTELTVDDFDITTLEGNLGYALVLYKVRGIRDWECAKFI